MTLSIWTEDSGFNFGVYNEQVAVSIELPAIVDPLVSFSVISGYLPDGLYISNNFIIGTASLIPDDAIYKFCIRATKGSLYADRTFYLTIQSNNPLSFITESGRLNCGINGQLFTIDDTYINFKIEATSLIQSDILQYSISSGSLPNNLVLSSDGIISGMLSKLSDQTRDKEFLESHFNIEISNGIYYKNRSFSIIEVGPYYLTADNNSIKIGSVVYTSDVTNIRPVQWKSDAYLGSYRYDNYLTVELDTYNSSSVNYTIDKSQILPPGTSFDAGLISGYVPPQNNYNIPYNFEISATRKNDFNNKTITNTKLFSIDIIGNLDNTFEWVSPSNLATITEGFPINISVEAKNTMINSIIKYEIINGSLPTGLTMSSDGIIYGVYSSSLQDVNSETYNFTVRAMNQYSGELSSSVTHYGIVEKDFIITAVHKQNSFSNIIVKPLLPSHIRTQWNTFITSEHIFPINMLYRPYDTEYGVQKNLEMLIYPGIESSSTESLVNATKLNNHKKRFQFGTISSAIAIDQTTNKALYEVVYIHMIDSLEQNGKHLPLRMEVPYINQYYPNSISLWRERLSLALDQTGNQVITDINLIPLWMRSIQPTNKNTIGFILAIPLCYCTVGNSSKIIQNIQEYGFDFTVIDYNIDRYIVDDFINPRYIIFNN